MFTYIFSFCANYELDLIFIYLLQLLFIYYKFKKILN